MDVQALVIQEKHGMPVLAEIFKIRKIYKVEKVFPDLTLDLKAQL